MINVPIRPPINRFVLVRHGTCECMDEMLFGRSIDPPLDAMGERQAHVLAERLSSERELLIEASPRRRTQQTAAAIAARARTEVITAIDVDEIDFGHWSGRTFTELNRDPHWQRWNTQRASTCTPAGERIATVQSRVTRHLQRLRDAFPGVTIVIVTHAEIIRSALLHWLSLPIDSYDRIEVAPASMSTVSFDGDEFRIDSINEQVGA